MAVDYMLYRPLLVDEHLNMRDVDNDGDLDATLCRASATLMALDAWTGGGLTTKATGTKWGKAQIRNALGKMRRQTGEPDRYGYNQTHVYDFVRAMGLPSSSFTVFNQSMPEIRKKLEDGFVVTLAGDVGLTPVGSPLRRYVNPVGHEIIVTRINKDGTKAAFIDPMTPHGTLRYERWAPWSHFADFAGRFGVPKARVAEIWKRGYGSEAEKQRRQKAGYRGDLIETERQLASAEDELASTKQALTLCQNTDPQLRITELEGALEEIKDIAFVALQ